MDLCRDRCTYDIFQETRSTRITSVEEGVSIKDMIWNFPGISEETKAWNEPELGMNADSPSD